jgi:diguanylate cyclase (GGDEF)-like protein
MNSFRNFSPKHRKKCKATGRGTNEKSMIHEKPLPTPKAVINDVSFHKISRPAVDLEPDAGIAKTMFSIGRLINDDYDSLSAYISEMMKFFEGAKRCSIYLGAKREISGKRKVVLEHHLTVHTNGDVRTESFGKKEAVTERNNPLLRSYTQKKPRLIDYREGMEIIFRNLDRESDRCDVYLANNGLFEEAVAVVPFYYREKNKPYGVIVIEGDLRCRGSEKTGFAKVYYSAKAAILAGMQTAFVFTHKFDWTTKFPGKHDFEIDFKRSINKLIKRKSKEGESTYFILIDLDRFKSINDTYGYLNGDVVLRMAAGEIVNSLRVGDRLRPGDKYFRWGGEEFAVLAENMALAEAFIVTERIRKRIKEIEVNVGDKGISVTCSIGLVDIATMLDKIDVKGEASKPVFDKCNRLLKLAKESGRDRIAFYDENGEPKFLNKSE